MRIFYRGLAVIGLISLLAACKTTGTSQAGLTSSVSTHIDLSQRSVMAYANGLTSRPVRNSKARFFVAHSGVQVGCLKPELVAMLRRVERHYGKPVIITSGFRSKTHNRRVRGARQSQHMYCRAADIRVSGVSKRALAKQIRSMKGVGGVGTYCRSSFVHIDVGSRRDWNWGCGKRRKRRS